MVDINIHTRNLPVYNSSQYIYVPSLWKFFFVFQDLIDRINSHFQRIAFQRNFFLLASKTLHHMFSRWIQKGFTGMALPKLLRRNYGINLPVSITYQNLHFFIKRWLSYVTVSLKREKYDIYMAQLSLKSLKCYLWSLLCGS